MSATSAGLQQGATFTVKLPVAIASRTPEVSPLPAASAAGGLPGVEVLIVDDDPDSVQLLCAILGGAGASVITATSAAEALESLEARVPHVVVSDVDMPGEDGYALVRRVRQRPREAGGTVPVIALTAYSGLQHRIRALEAGFDMHIPKPVDPVELTTAISRLVAHQR